MSNDWIEHNGGPQPVADDVWVQTNDDGNIPTYDGDIPTYGWEIDWDYGFRYRILNQHLIDAARLEGIRLGLEAAMKIVWKDARWMGSDGPRIGEKLWLTLRDINPDTIAKEADNEPR